MTGTEIVCPSCHEDIDENANYCPTCGEEQQRVELVCAFCGKQVDENVDNCPNCGEEQPQKEVYKYDWERDVELPVTFGYEVYSDNYELWDNFTEEVFGKRLCEEEIENIPEDVPSMKYCVETLYYKLDEDHKLWGPFLTQNEARKA